MKNKKILAALFAIIFSIFAVATLLKNNITVQAQQGDIYVSPTGSASNSGTYESPLTLEEAIKKIEAGKTIWMLEGTYSFNKTIIIEEANAGSTNKYKSLKAYNNKKVVLDFSGQQLKSSNRGIVLDASYWHLYGLDIKGAGDNGMLLSGDNNIIEMCQFYENRDSGLQISRYNTNYNTLATWPSNNLIKNCTSFNNCDASGENADGFAPKLTCGNGNVFDGCISYCNSDDGWDLYAKPETGSIGVVTLRNCVAFGNGKLTNGSGSADGDMNGFKLGGMGIPSAHIVENCIAFNNGATGFTDNNNGGAIKLTNCTSANNGLYTSTGNYICYRASSSATYTNILSYKNSSSDNFKGKVVTSIYDYKGKYCYTASTTFSGNSKDGSNKVTISDSDFESVTVPGYSNGKYSADYHKIFRNADGSINLNGLYNLKSTSTAKSYGVGANLSVQNVTEPPTEAPTQAPTEAPTQAPTEAPTQAPTEVPTQAPTEAPTQAPTQEPTKESTQATTEVPTKESTVAPTVEPTDEAVQGTENEGSNTPLVIIIIILSILAVGIIAYIVYNVIKNKKGE